MLGEWGVSGGGGQSCFDSGFMVEQHTRQDLLGDVNRCWEVGSDRGERGGGEDGRGGEDKVRGDREIGKRK